MIRRLSFSYAPYLNLFDLDPFLDCFSDWVVTVEAKMSLIIILSMWKVGKNCTLRPRKSSKNSTSKSIKTSSGNSPFAPQFSKHLKMMLMLHTKPRFLVGGWRLYTPVINFSINGPSLSDYRVPLSSCQLRQYGTITYELWQIYHMNCSRNLTHVQ